MTDPRSWFAGRGKWWFFAVPAVGIGELILQLVQTHSVVPTKDWEAARAYVAANAKPEDLVAFAPRWTDPIGREMFGPELATLEREARADDTSFPRAFEVSIRGGALPEFEGWTRSGEASFGRVKVVTWTNPSAAHVIDDLVSLADPSHLQVFRGATACPFTHAAPESGSIGSGPGIPADRFVCPGGGFAASLVLSDLDYQPRRCIYVPPQAGAPVRLELSPVRFGKALHGHHGLDAQAEREKRGAPITLTFRTEQGPIGSVTHYDGDGWKGFEFDTSDLAGQSERLIVEVSAPSAEQRWYCFQADTR